MAEKVAVMRLQKDFARLVKDPVPYVTAAPKPSNVLEWYFIVTGPDDSPYEGGFYLGRMNFPSDYPFKPPSIMLLTPSGRFAPNQRLCLSNSDFHPESWNPAWNVGTILCGLVSFMTGNQTTVGSIKTTDLEKRVLARASIAWNLGNPTFRSLFPTMLPMLEKMYQEAVDQKKADEAVQEADKFVGDQKKADAGGNDPFNAAPRNAFARKWLRILFVAGLAAFAVAVRFLSSSFST